MEVQYKMPIRGVLFWLKWDGLLRAQFENYSSISFLCMVHFETSEASYRT